MSQTNLDLVRAAHSGDISKVRELLDRGADANARVDDDWTALIVASSKGHTSVVRMLLDKGADINAKNKAGGTALTSASFNGCTETVKLLLDRGANFNAKVTATGATALILASSQGHNEIVRLLEVLPKYKIREE